MQEFINREFEKMVTNISKNSVSINEKFDRAEALGKRNQFLLEDLRIAIDDVKGK